jgi:hypothetical protein
MLVMEETIEEQEIIPVENYIFLKQWGKEGKNEGEFDNPYGITADDTGNIYVADTFNHSIQKFDSNNNFVTKWAHAVQKTVSSTTRSAWQQTAGDIFMWQIL